MQYKTFFISDYCSAGCIHCPSGGSNQTIKFECQKTNLSSFINQLSDNDIALITGGEPLEASDLFHVCEIFNNNGIYFRIATGGFIDLSKFNNILRSDMFAALSMGTDILIRSRNQNSNYNFIWDKNAKYLVQNNISHSVTIYYDGDNNIIDELKDHLVLLKPKFIMILIDEQFIYKIARKIFEKKLIKILGNLPILYSHTKE